MKRAPWCCLWLMIASITVMADGCSSSSSVDPASVRAQQLTGAQWVLQRAVARGASAADTTDVTEHFPYLTVTFTSAGTYQTSTHGGTWSLTPDETAIVFDKDSLSKVTATIVELSADVLHITTTAAADGTGPMDLTFMAATKAPNYSQVNFETLWREFDARYSFFVVKGIDWDSLHVVYRAQVTSRTDVVDLFQLLSSLLANLRDPHVSLSTPYGSYSYAGWYLPYPANYLGPAGLLRYLSEDDGTIAGGAMHYGKIGTDMGYLYVGPQLVGNATAWAQGIDLVVEKLQNCKGVIVDLRNNVGGNDALGSIVAGRFTDRSRTYSYIRWRSGPLHGDFTDYQALTIAPQGARQFLKPVIVLTNRRCVSSAEGTLLMFKALPHVTVIGDTTAGGSANPIALTLPNGWNYRVSRWIQYTAEHEVFEGRGIAPDIPVRITSADSTAGKDTILERGIQILQGL